MCFAFTRVALTQVLGTPVQISWARSKNHPGAAVSLCPFDALSDGPQGRQQTREQANVEQPGSLLCSCPRARARRLIRRRCVPRPDGASGSLPVKLAKTGNGGSVGEVRRHQTGGSAKERERRYQHPAHNGSRISSGSRVRACSRAVRRDLCDSAPAPTLRARSATAPCAAFPRAARSPGLTYATCLLRSLPVATQSRRPYAPPRCRRIRFLRPRDPPFRRTPAHRNRAHATRPQPHPGKPGA